MALISGWLKPVFCSTAPQTPGKRGAVAAAAVKRQAREAQIIEAIGLLTAQGERLTMRKVAELVGCSQPALSQQYKHLFPAR